MFICDWKEPQTLLPFFWPNQQLSAICQSICVSLLGVIFRLILIFLINVDVGFLAHRTLSPENKQQVLTWRPWIGSFRVSAICAVLRSCHFLFSIWNSYAWNNGFCILCINCFTLICSIKLCVRAHPPSHILYFSLLQGGGLEWEKLLWWTSSRIFPAI